MSGFDASLMRLAPVQAADESVALRVLDGRIRAREEALARELGEMARALVEADAVGAAALFTLNALTEQRDRVAAAYRDAVRERDRLQTAAATSATRYLSGRARERERGWAERLVWCEDGIKAASVRHTEARLRAQQLQAGFDAARRGADAELSSLLAQRAQLLMAADQTRAQGPGAITHPLPPTVAAEPPTEEQLKAIREAIVKDDWADLPAFHGSGQVSQRECFHCGEPVPAGRKRFCSSACHRMHLEAYGTPT